MTLRRWTACVIALTMLLGLTGCWDVREMNQLALVMAVGIDKAEQPGRYEVTIQVARPGAAGKGKGGKGGSGGGQSVYTASADGDTIFAAIRNLAQFTSRRIMWAHNNVVVIGESLARDDITPVVDFFTRNQELRMRTWVVVARDTTAKAVVSAKTGMEDVPADSISALFRYGQLTGESVRTDMNEVASAYFAKDLHPVISAVRLTERSLETSDRPGEHGGSMQVELRGSAIFHRARLVGYLDEEAGRGLLWLRREMGNAVITIPCPGQAERHIAVEIRTPKVKLDSDISGSTPTVRVRVNASGYLSEQDCVTPGFRNLELKEFAEAAYRAKIESEIRAALDVLQNDFRTDAVRFARMFHVDHPDWFRSHIGGWDSIFPRIKTQVLIRVDIPKMGLYTKPMNLRSP